MTLLVAAGWFADRYWESRTETAGPTPIDVGFAQSMSQHHKQAIGMAQLMLDGRSSSLPGLARSIADSQLFELGEMRGWLDLWDKPWQAPGRGMDWMLLGSAPPDAELTRYLMDCRRSPTGMAGLATDAEINRLRSLQGRARDDHFLRLMLAHHEGAIPMARFAARESRLPAVRRLAGRIVVDQSEEIARIQQMLQRLAASGYSGAEVE
jgi:uncharacterized protein (DUF305 family)